jgi:hypothetical protein
MAGICYWRRAYRNQGGRPGGHRGLVGQLVPQRGGRQKERRGGGWDGGAGGEGAQTPPPKTALHLHEIKDEPVPGGQELRPRP